jgi:hypothetical protein
MFVWCMPVSLSPHAWANQAAAHLQVESQRKLRKLAEDEAHMTATQLQLQAERQAVLAAAGQAAIVQKAQEQQKR